MINNIKEIESWKGFKEIKVVNVIKEDDFVTSFYLKSHDGDRLPKFIAGQFIAVKMKNEDGSFTIPRQYTLSLNSNEEFYRISVKREAEGLLSKKLCDEVDIGDILYITAPIGKFVLNDSERPLILMGGGIGITPMIAMAYDAVKTNREIHLIYSLPNSKNHSFEEEIKKLDDENENLKVTIFYTRPLENDKLGDGFHMKGRITKEYIEKNLPKNGDFYFCGPLPFMKALYSILMDIGIEKENINYELFGPGSDITK